jgi:hypothetical protein
MYYIASRLLPLALFRFPIVFYFEALPQSIHTI